MALLIRRARREDVPAIREIYNYAIRHLTATFDTEEKSLEDRQAWFTAHDDRYPIFVVDKEGVIAGWASLSPYRERAAFVHTVESSVYLHPDHCGRGIGTALMQAVMEAAKAIGHHAVIAQIVGHNEASIALHRKFGFTEVGTLREVGWKFEQWLDLYVMEAVL